MRAFRRRRKPSVTPSDSHVEVACAFTKQGLRDLCATGSVLGLPYSLGLKAEVLHLADRTSEALEAIEAAERVVERSEQREWCAEPHRLGRARADGISVSILLLAFLLIATSKHIEMKLGCPRTGAYNLEPAMRVM